LNEPTAPATRRQGQDGQGLVELALVLPVFMLVLFGLFDVGKLVYTNSALSQAAREGTRLAAAEAAWIGVPGSACVGDPSGITSARPGAHVCPADVTSFKSHISDAVHRNAVALGPITNVYVSCNAGDALDPAPTGDWTEASGGNGCRDALGNAISGTGDLVSVRIEYSYQTFTPIISSLLGSVPFSGSASMVIN
jgi:hypothetical protein